VRWIDTGLEPPDDIVPWQDAPWVGGRTYCAAPRSVIVLWGEGHVAKLRIQNVEVGISGTNSKFRIPNS
jgi:hypothetical protein